MAVSLKSDISSVGSLLGPLPSRRVCCIPAAASSLRPVSTTNGPACTSSFDNKQRALAVIAHSASFSRNNSTSSSRRTRASPLGTAAAATETRALLRLPTAPVTVSEDYDETAAPIHVQLGSRIEQDDLVCGQGTFDGNNYDAQDWEELSNLLSFDGEEHKYVTRKMPGENMRVEDMFASFDGDDFEAVMHAARGGEPTADSTVAEAEAILAAAGASIDAAAATAGGSANSSSIRNQPLAAGGGKQDMKQEEDNLFLAVSRRRAVAMAAELQSKKNPKPRRRRSPLGSEPGDAWMFEDPAVAAAAGRPQELSLQLYRAAQRALLPPLLPADAAAAAAAAQELQPAAAKASEVVVIVVQRPEVRDGTAAAPAPHAVEQQEASSLAITHHLLSSGRASSTGGSSSSRRAAAALETAGPMQGTSAAGLGGAAGHGSSSRGAAMPAAAAPEGLLGLAAVAAATVATEQLQPEVLRRCSSRVLATPAALDPLAVAPATLGAAAAAAGSVAVLGAAAELEEELHAELMARLPALPSSDEDEEAAMTERAVQECSEGGISSRVGISGCSAAADYRNEAGSSSSGGIGTGWIAPGSADSCNAPGVGGPDRRQASRVALKRALTALLKLQSSSLVSTAGQDCGSSSH